MTNAMMKTIENMANIDEFFRIDRIMANTPCNAAPLADTFWYTESQRTSVSRYGKNQIAEETTRADYKSKATESPIIFFL